MKKSYLSNQLLQVITFVMLALASPSQLFAHSAVLWAEVDGDRIFVEAYFSNGKKVRDAQIVVMDVNEQQLLKGRTDPEGRFDFPLPNTRNMTIVLIINEA